MNTAQPVVLPYHDYTQFWQQMFEMVLIMNTAQPVVLPYHDYTQFWQQMFEMVLIMNTAQLSYPHNYIQFRQ